VRDLATHSVAAELPLGRCRAPHPAHSAADQQVGRCARPPRIAHGHLLSVNPVLAAFLSERCSYACFARSAGPCGRRLLPTACFLPKPCPMKYGGVLFSEPCSVNTVHRVAEPGSKDRIRRDRVGRSPYSSIPASSRTATHALAGDRRGDERPSPAARRPLPDPRHHRMKSRTGGRGSVCVCAIGMGARRDRSDGDAPDKVTMPLPGSRRPCQGRARPSDACLADIGR